MNVKQNGNMRHDNTLQKKMWKICELINGRYIRLRWIIEVEYFEVHSYSEMGGGWNPVESLLGDFRVIKIFINVNQFKEI